MSRFDRYQLTGKLIVLDTCVLKIRGGGECDKLIEFLTDVGATPAITNIVLQEVMYGYLFPPEEKLNILHSVENGTLELLDPPPAGRLIKLILKYLQQEGDFDWMNFIRGNVEDFLIAITTLYNAKEQEKEALVMTDNIRDFELWKQYGLRCLSFEDLDRIRYE